MQLLFLWRETYRSVEETTGQDSFERGLKEGETKPLQLTFKRLLRQTPVIVIVYTHCVACCIPYFIYYGTSAGVLWLQICQFDASWRGSCAAVS